MVKKDEDGPRPQRKRDKEFERRKLELERTDLQKSQTEIVKSLRFIVTMLIVLAMIAWGVFLLLLLN